MDRMCFVMRVLIGVVFSTISHAKTPPLPVGLISFRGDPDPYGQYLHDVSESRFRIATSLENLLWPHGEVPYKISDGFTDQEIASMKQEMRVLEDNTKSGNTFCVRFVPESGQANHVTIRKSLSGPCTARLGKVGGDQSIYLPEGCIPSSVIHELMHTLGFYHEQQRPDRDDYVTIITENIQPYYLHAFQVPLQPYKLQNLSYDGASVMQYSQRAFSIDYKEPTIVPKSHFIFGGIESQLRLPMSAKDVTRVQRLYGCQENLTNYNNLNLGNVVLLCDFDHDHCNFTQSKNTDIKWTRNPHLAYDNSYFLEANLTGHPNQTTTLSTPEFEPGRYCIGLYIQKEATLGLGRVKMAWTSRRASYPTKMTSLSISGLHDKPANWYSTNMMIHMDAKWRVRFSVYSGDIEEGFVRIDNFMVYRKEDGDIVC